MRSDKMSFLIIIILSQTHQPGLVCKKFEKIFHLGQKGVKIKILEKPRQRGVRKKRRRLCADFIFPSKNLILSSKSILRTISLIA